MRKKIIALMMVVSLLMAYVPASAQDSSSFSDMPDNWSTAALQKAVANGLLTGYDGKIMPGDPLTRAQMATVINRAFGATGEADISGYLDMAQEAWHYREMARAVRMGTFQGDGSLLMPDVPITREEAFLVMARAMKLEDIAEEPAGFDDLEAISDWAREAVFAMIEAGYVQGSGGMVHPKATITRAEFAQLMDNLIKQYIREAGVHDTVVEGNIMVNVPGVTLENVVVTGDLILGDGVGEGDVILDDVTVEGRLLVRGGGEDTVIIRGDSHIGTIIIAKVDGVVRILNESGNVIVEVIADGKDDIILVGSFGKVIVLAEDVDVDATDADFDDGNVIGDGSRIIVDEPASSSGSSRRSLDGVSIAGSLDYADSALAAELSPSGATASLVWERIDPVDGTATQVGTGSNYTTTAADIGMHLRVSATGTGSYRGTVADTELIGFADGVFTTSSAAFEIANWYQLDNMRQVVDWGSESFMISFLLTENLGGDDLVPAVQPQNGVSLDYVTEGWSELVNDADGWEPVGVSGNEFVGLFDGNGMVIKDLWIDRQMAGSLDAVSALPAPSEGTGLFGLAMHAEIRDLTLADAHVAGTTHVGALAGGIDAESTVSNVHVDAASSVEGTYYVGGIAGVIRHTAISNSLNEADVQGYSYVGGIVGSIEEALVEQSGNKGAVDGGYFVGGITGALFASSIVAPSQVNGDAHVEGILESFNEGFVDGFIESSAVSAAEVVYHASGGIAGAAYGGIIADSSNTADLYAYPPSGGVVGITNGAAIENNFSTGSNTFMYNAFYAEGMGSNPIYGYDEGGSLFIGNYYSAGSLVDPVVPALDLGVYGVSLEEMRNPLTFDGWDFSGIWAMNLDDNDGLPFHRWQGFTPVTLEVVMPAGTVAYGGAVTGAALAGGAASIGGTAVAGSFTVVDGPALTESHVPGTTLVAMAVFTPDDGSLEMFAGDAVLTVTKAALTVTAEDSSKTYGDALTFEGTEFTTDGLVFSDTVTYAALASNGATTSAAVGTYDIVPSAAEGLNLDRYHITYENGTLTVSPRAITVSAVPDTKVYDGTTGSTATPVVVSGSLLAGHSLDWSQSFLDKHVGTDKTLEPATSGFVLEDTEEVTGNYAISTVATTGGAITARDLALSGFTAEDKPYDGTTTAAGSFEDNRISGDDLSFSYDADFENADVGADKTVTFSNILISGGADQNNYNLATTSGSATASITVAEFQRIDVNAGSPYVILYFIEDIKIDPSKANLSLSDFDVAITRNDGTVDTVSVVSVTNPNGTSDHFTIELPADKQPALGDLVVVTLLPTGADKVVDLGRNALANATDDYSRLASDYHVDVAGDEDSARVYLVAGVEYVFETTGSSGDPYLYLYDSGMEWVASNDDGGAGLESKLVYTPSTSGYFFIQVRAYGDSSILSGTLTQWAPYEGLIDTVSLDEGTSKTK